MARFLVVDDDHSTVHGLTRLLQDDGHDVAPFTSGADAVGALARESFDAVLTDLEMPHTDGYAVVRAARAHQPAACVVVATARDNAKEREAAEAGACIIVDKPLDYERVTRAVSDCRQLGGPGAHGGCHMKSGAQEASLSQLRRR